jgi:hypothetical protein
MSYECPVDGCQYQGSKNQVIGHYSGSGGEHTGGYQDVLQMLEDQDSNPEAEPEPTEPNPEPDGGENPLFGAGGSNPDKPESNPKAEPEPTEPNPEKSGEPVCPECGGEVVDFRAYQPGQYHTVNGQNVFVRGDYVCSECRGWFVNE